MLALLAACVAALPVAAAPARPLELEVERDGDRFAVHALLRLEAPPKLVWDTLTDYERFGDFMPDVHSSRVLTRDGNRLTVEHRGEFRVLFFARPVRVRLAVEHRPFTGVVARSLPQLADGGAPTLVDFDGRYELAVVRDGAVQLTYDARFALAEPLPPVVGTLFGRAAVRSALRENFAALAREIERRRAARPRIERER